MVPVIWSVTQNFLSLWSIFCPPLSPHYEPRKLKFWKNEKNTWRYHFTNFDIWSYDIWFFRYRVEQTKFFCHFEPFFALLPPGDIIILHNCTKNRDHMLYWSLDTACNRFNYFLFWAIFCPFTPEQPKKAKFWKNKKNTWRYHHFTYMYQNYDQMMYSSWDKVCHKCNCYFSFWAIFCPFTPLTAQKIQILKKWKNCLEISFYIRVPKITIRWCMVPEIWCVTAGRADGRMDRRKKWHRRWVPHLIKTSYIRARFLSIFLKIGTTWGRT